MEGETMLPADKRWTTARDGCVKLDLDSESQPPLPPISVISMFKNTAMKSPDHTAMAVKREGQWKTWTYAQYYADVQMAAKSLIKLGLEPHHGVCIIGFNSPEWFISQLATIHAGGLPAGIYITNTPEACQYVMIDCDCDVVIVENDYQLQKVLKVWDDLPHVKAIVQWDGQPGVDNANVYSWKEFIALGEDVPESILNERVGLHAPNKCATLIYTSGTTGNPKGVMLSHDNLTWVTRKICTDMKLGLGEDHILSYLPLSHVAAQVLDLYVGINLAATVHFAQPDALKGSLGDTLREVRPTVFFGVPRVWEKIQEKMMAAGREASNFKKRIAMWAKDVGFRGNQAKISGTADGPGRFSWTVANMLVFNKVKAQLGLDRCKICISGAAPLTRTTLDFFMSLDILICEVYGMSENTGPHSLGLPWKVKLGSVGTVVPHVRNRINEPDADGNGEILMKGRHVFMGYINAEEKTNEALEEDGWLHTGDVGKLDDEGFLYITGRIKEIIITAGAENIVPVRIEDTVKKELPCINNCMVIGDRRKYLTILLAFKTDVDPATAAPLDSLTPESRDWCKARGSPVTTVSEILEGGDKNLIKGIQDGIDKANEHAISRAAKIQKWTILPRDFSIPGGELGPTMKLRRNIVIDLYSETIDKFYDEEKTSETPHEPALKQ